MTYRADSSISRRTMLATAGFGVLAAAMLPLATSAGEAAPTTAEKSGVDLVKRFILGWTQKNYDANKEMETYLSSPCLVRPIEDKPALTTPADAAKVFLDFMKDGSRVSRVDFHRVFATGPLVVTRRTDIVTIPNKPNANYEVAGIFLVKGGKIHEWTDYIVS